MKKAVAYMRMSTDKQEHSLESQKRLLQDFAKRNDYSIKKFYADEGISGRVAEKRPAFMQMIEDSVKNEFQYVLIYDSSRFARNLEQSIVYKSLLKKNGVTLISITEPILDEDTALITDALLGAMNEMYSRKLSKNVSRGMEQKALRGEYCAPAPFGYLYDKNKKKLVIHEKDASVIRYLFQETLRGRSSYSLGKEMMENNICNQSGHILDKARVDYILKNPTYKGYLRWKSKNKHILEKSNHEPIIKEPLFDKVQDLLHQKSLKRIKNSKPPEQCKHWLSGMMRCTECNCTFVYSKGYQHRSDRFRCSGQSKGRCSSAISFTVQDISKNILNILKEITYQKREAYLLNRHEPEKIWQDSNKTINKLFQSLHRAKESYLAGIDTINEYKETKTKIIKEIKKIEQLKKKKINQSSNVTSSDAKIINVVDLFETEENDLNKRIVLQSVVEKITIDKKNKNIKLYFFS